MAKQLIECAYCKGRGTYTYLKKGVRGVFREEPAYEARCPVCFGRGKVEVEEPARTCAFCKGTGISKRGSLVTCPVCKGKGMVTVKEPATECPACHGKGRKPGSALYCIKCRGTGFITLPK